MSLGWLATIALVGVPLVAEAECGWLLMLPDSPESTGSLNATQRDAWRRKPLSQWHQEGAYDSAADCEGIRLSVGGSLPLEQMRDREVARRFALFRDGRCLPASVVPVK